MDDGKYLFVKEEERVIEVLNEFDLRSEDYAVIVRDSQLRGYIWDYQLRQKIAQDVTVVSSSLRNFYESKLIHINNIDFEYLKSFFYRHGVPFVVYKDSRGQIQLIDKDLILPEPKNGILADVPFVIMAGGMGKRLLPYTKVLPKPLLPIGNKPILEHIINKAQTYGVKNFYLSVGYKASLIKSYFRQKLYDIRYITELNPLGTAGSLYYLKGIVTKPFFVSYADVFLNTDLTKLYKFHLKNKALITIVVTVQSVKLDYGVCKVNGINLQAINEKPRYYYLANSGFYVLSPEVLDFIERAKYLHMTDLIKMAIEQGHKVVVYSISPYSWFDFGTKEKFFRNRIKFLKMNGKRDY